jgi:hypothetical protein
LRDTYLSCSVMAKLADVTKQMSLKGGDYGM